LVFDEEIDGPELLKLGVIAALPGQKEMQEVPEEEDDCAGSDVEIDQEE